jgi:hypothetical protein
MGRGVAGGVGDLVALGAAMSEITVSWILVGVVYTFVALVWVLA